MESSASGSLDENARQQFEAAWRQRHPEPIERFLPPENQPTYLGTLEELVHIEMEFLWKAGNRPAGATILSIPRPPFVENYLARFPHLNQTEVVLRLLEQEYQVRHRFGDRPAAAEYRARFPALITTGREMEDWIQNSDTAHGTRVAGKEPGSRLGRYYLRSEHGRGGFGLVWRATDEALGREVALKQLSEDLVTQADYRQRFVAEACIAARLQHPGIVPVYDVGEQEGNHPYYTMKLVRGQTLAEAIRRFQEENLTPGERSVERLRLLAAFLGVARAMAYAHSQGVIHRDLKPDNIVLGDYGETVILDWGLAKVLHQESAAAVSAPMPAASPAPADQTQAGTVMGTPAYMAPEQAAGRIDEVDERSDVYALGAILYQVLTGRPPFQGSDSEKVLEQVVTSAPPRPRAVDPHIPGPLEAICLKAMAKQPDQRYATADLLARDLERFHADEPVEAYRERHWDRLGRWARRHRPVVASACVALVLLVAGAVGGLFFWQETENRRQRQIDKHLADLRQSAKDAEVFALTELRAGRFAGAEKILRHAVESLQDEPALEDLRSQLQVRWDRARGLVDFYRHADQAEKLAFLEYDTEALADCEAALRSLGILADREWAVHLPASDLTDPLDHDPQHLHRQLQEDVYRTLMLLSALHVRPTLMKGTDDPAAAAACRSALDAVDLFHHFRPSFSGRLIELFCFARLGKIPKLSAWKRAPEPTSAADYYYAGMAHVWLVSAGKDDGIKRLFELPLARFLSGMDFENPRETSERFLRTAADREPRHYWTQLWMAWSFFAAGNFQAAAQAYDTCVALRPEYALGYAERGRILIKQVQGTSRAESRQTLERRGLQDLDRAQALEPDEPFIHWLRADALRDLGRVSGALEALARAMELERPLARWKGQRIGEEKHHFFDTGARFAGGITQKEPGQANAWAVLAMAEFGLGRFESAARAADRALEHRPHHPRALAVRGALRQQQKQFQLALDDFNRVLADAPGIYLAAAGRAQSYFSLDQFEEAVASFDHLLTFAVSDWQRVEAHLGKARSLERLGKLEMARQALENARKIDPNSTLDETPP